MSSTTTLCLLPALSLSPPRIAWYRRQLQRKRLLVVQKCRGKCFTVGISSPSKEQWRGQALTEIADDGVGSGFLCGAHYQGLHMAFGCRCGTHLYLSAWLTILFGIQSLGIKRELLLLRLSVTQNISKCTVSSSLVNQLLRKTGNSSEVEMHCLYLLNLLSCKSFLCFWITELTEVMACGEEEQLLTTASPCALLHIKIYWSTSLVAVLAHMPVPTCMVSFPEIILCFLQQRLRQFGLKNSKCNESSVFVL